MILNRLGNKSLIAKKIQSHFPRHDIYMEPFFGAGGMYFNKPKAKFNYINDMDDDVYNLFRQIIDNKDEFVKLLKDIPITEKQFKSWGKGKKEEDDLMNAIRFIFISNFGLFGKPDTLRIGATNPKNIVFKNIDKTLDWLDNAYFFNVDFRKFFGKFYYKDNISRCFCYCDPPYLGTGDNYSDSFVEQDTRDLFQVLIDSKVKFAVSEFDNGVILDLVEQHGLNLITVGERTNLMNKRTEVLVTNYDSHPTLFD